MSKPGSHTILEIIELSRVLGEFGQIERVTKLPDGRRESDSHHSFALALVSFDLAEKFAPELDTHKILLYSLVHDLPELITGDVSTLTATPEDLSRKSQQDKAALKDVAQLLKKHPSLLRAIEAYEAKEDEESRFVYWIDKLMTIPTHFFDDGKNLRELGIKSKADAETWYVRTVEKLNKHQQAHGSVVLMLELAYKKLRDDLLDE